MSVDEWRTEIGGYDPGKFYTKATDSKGHKESINLKVSPSVARLLSEIVQSRAIPAYRTVGDFVRDAITHRLHWLDREGYTRGKRDQSVLSFLEAIDRRLQEEQQNLAYLEEMQKLRATVKDLCLHGELGKEQAKKLLQDAAESLSILPEGSLWHVESRKALREAWRELGEQEE